MEVSAIKTVFLNDCLILLKSISRPAKNIRNIRPKDEKKSKRALLGIISSRDFPIIIPIMISITITGTCIYFDMTGAIVMARSIIMSTIVVSMIVWLNINVYKYYIEIWLTFILCSISYLDSFICNYVVEFCSKYFFSYCRI